MSESELEKLAGILRSACLKTLANLREPDMDLKALAAAMKQTADLVIVELTEGN